LRWQIGGVEVALVRERTVLVDAADAYPGADLSALERHASWLRPHFLADDGRLPLSLHAFLLRSRGRTILVDSCVGEHHVEGREVVFQGPSHFHEGLAAAGATPGDVDVVLCTHLHFDHVGWHTRWDGTRWTPTFPNARHLIARAEHDHWAAGAPGYAFTFADTVQPVVAAGLADLVGMDHEVTDEVRLVPTPGHSPGHVAVELSSRGERAVITGDLVHNPVQLNATGWRHKADHDPDLARATREAFVARWLGSGGRIFGSHFGGPASGLLEPGPDGPTLRTS
jgi:glyoxylase-like metal-dependent hydrolase (beta-lactamase superfamily II)